MNILITSFSYPAPDINHFGGSFVEGEAVAYALNGAKVIVLTPQINGGKTIERTQKNIKIIRFQYLWPKRLQTLLKPNHPIYAQLSLLNFFQIPIVLLFFAANILKFASWADIIHSQWTLTALLAIPAKWLFRTKIVLTARGSDIRLLPVWLNRLIHKSVDGAIDCFGPQVWNEQYKKKFSANYLKLPLIVDNSTNSKIPNDLNKILIKKPNSLIILYVGRFHYRKISNLQLPLIDLIYACDIMRLTQPNFHVFYLGDGELFNQLAKLVDELDLCDYISLLGPKNNIFDYIGHCHLGVGGVAFNGVSQEFSISGKPQILIQGGLNFNTPWKNKKNALFVKGGNRKNIAETIVWASNNRDEIEKIGMKAKNVIKTLIADPLEGGEFYIAKFKNLLDQPSK